MTGLPAGLREALVEAAKRFDHLVSIEAVVDVQLPALASWLADHDAEVRQQGRNEAAQAILTMPVRGHVARAGQEFWARVARGGSDLKGQDDG